MLAGMDYTHTSGMTVWSKVPNISAISHFKYEGTGRAIHVKGTFLIFYLTFFLQTDIKGLRKLTNYVHHHQSPTFALNNVQAWGNCPCQCWWNDQGMQSSVYLGHACQLWADLSRIILWRKKKNQYCYHHWHPPLGIEAFLLSQYLKTFSIIYIVFNTLQWMKISINSIIMVK